MMKNTVIEAITAVSLGANVQPLATKKMDLKIVKKIPHRSSEPSLSNGNQRETKNNQSDLSITNKYVVSGIAALNNWKPGRVTTAKPEAQVIDMFSGCGGMSLGFAAMGQATGAYRLIGGIDINETSLHTYEHNFGVAAQKVDVRTLSESKAVLNRFLGTLPLYDEKLPTVLIGCAPCQGFTAHRKKNWNQPPDVRNSLVEAFTDVAVSLMPECIVMENVPELLSGRYWKHFEYMRDRLVKSGYVVKHEIHNAATQGVPQARFRALVIAMKSDFTMPEPRFLPSEFRSVRQAISNLPPVSAGEQSLIDAMHKSANHRASTIEVIKMIPKDGGSRPNGIGPKCLQDFKGFADVYGRLSWDRPAITITHYARNPASGRFVHPQQDRGLTMREAARLQSFPDGFEFTGGLDDIFRQIGEAVPPVLSVAVAASILTALRGQKVARKNNLISAPVNDLLAGITDEIKGSLG